MAFSFLIVRQEGRATGFLWEELLTVICLLALAKAVIDQSRDGIYLCILCLALLVFEIFNKRWGVK